MQIGQILQTLALLPYEQPPTDFSGLLGKFDEAIMPKIITSILNSALLSLDTMFPKVLSDSEGQELYARKVCIGSMYEMNVMHAYLQSEAVEKIGDSGLREEIKGRKW